MSDPVDDILDETITPPAPAEANTVTIPKEELERLQQVQRQLEEVTPVLRQLQEGGALHDARARAIEQPADGDPNAEYWQNPAAVTEKIAQRVMAPAAQQMSEKFAALEVNSFKVSKQHDAFYPAVVGDFDRYVKSMNQAQLGQLPSDVLRQTLEAAWNAAVGAHVQKRMSERPKPEAPVNLGGGGGTAPAGPKQKRTLQEIDSAAYNWAVQNGLTPEEIQELADEIE